jgi:hypothetical protein
MHTSFALAALAAVAAAVDTNIHFTPYHAFTFDVMPEDPKHDCDVDANDLEERIEAIKLIDMSRGEDLAGLHGVMDLLSEKATPILNYATNHGLISANGAADVSQSSEISQMLDGITEMGVILATFTDRVTAIQDDLLLLPDAYDIKAVLDQLEGVAAAYEARFLLVVASIEDIKNNAIPALLA